jgi:hypothetical protein
MLSTAFPRAFQRIQRNGDVYFEASSNWSNTKRLFAFTASHELVVVLEMDMPSGASIRGQAPASEAALLILGCLCARLQTLSFDVGLLSDQGLVSGLLLSTRLCQTHVTAADIKERVYAMRAVAAKVDSALRSPNETLRLLWIGLEPRAGFVIARTSRPARRPSQLTAARFQTHRSKPKVRARQ